MKIVTSSRLTQEPTDDNLHKEESHSEAEHAEEATFLASVARASSSNSCPHHNSYIQFTIS